MIVRDMLYIDGGWVKPDGSGTIEVLHSATEEALGSVPSGSAADAERAVEAAARAFDGWAGTSVDERSKYLTRIQEGLQERMADIANVIAAEVGMPIHLANLIQAGLPMVDIGSMPQVLDGFPFEERVGNSLVVREPVGVVAAITPWNYPLHQVAAKVGPALAAGCTVVLKPASEAPMSAFILAEIIDEVGLPPGVFNLVSGPGRVVGEVLASHPQVDMISFTGSTEAGRRIGELASRTVKRVALELGGKSANILLEDADLSRAVPGGLNACLLNSGQTCSALTRMIVPRSRLDEVEALAVSAVTEFVVGDPFADGTRIGPLVSKAQQERVRSYIVKGVEEGATLIAGGPEQPEGLERGYYVKPTIFSRVTNGMTIAQEEIFGPVLSIIPVDSEEEAIAVANDSIYGLAGGVSSADPEHAKAVARRLRTGQVEINGGSFNPMAPFGGYKQSGNGRELGRFGLEEFLEVKAMQM